MDAGGQATATVTVPTSPCGFGVCTENHKLHVGADFSPGRAFDVHGSELAFRVSVAAGPPPPPPPAVSMTVAPMRATAIWGQSATYTITVSEQNAFSGAVSLVVDQLPNGVMQSLSSSTLNLTAGGPAQSSTLTLTPPFAASPLGTSMFRVRATSTAPTVTLQRSLTIAGTDGAFTKSTNVGASVGSPSTCGASVSATYQSFGVNDIRVTLTAPGPVSTQAIAAVFHAFSAAPDCRTGVVMHPCQAAGCSGAGDPAISWYNLGWNTATGATAVPGRIQNLVGIHWHQFWFSADQSLLMIVAKRTQAVTCVPNCPHLDMRAFVYDSITGTLLDQVDFRTRVTGSISDPIADVTGATRAGNTVTINYVNETGAASTRSITLP